MIIKKVFIISFFAAFFLFQASLGFFARAITVPHYIGYEGQLTDSSDEYLTGTYDITFRMYEASTGGTALWTEIQSNTTVTNGYFSVSLGDTTALNLDFDRRYWVSIEIESDGEMTPRQPINAVGYAYSSDITFGAYATTTAPATYAGALYYDTDDGNLYVYDAIGAAWVDITDSGSASNVFAQNGNSFSALATLGTNDAYDLAFETSNSEALRIDSSGNIGIATTSPAFLLDVYGSTRIDGALRTVTTNATTTNTDNLTVFSTLSLPSDSVTDAMVSDTLTITGYMQDEDINSFSELQSWVSDKTLVNEEDIFTIDADWVNTANPWSDNEVANDITASNYLALTNWYSTTTHANLATLPGLTITESQISDLNHYADADTGDYIDASTTMSVNNWNLAFNWGDHGSQNYLDMDTYPNVDTDSTDDFSGSWDNLTNKPATSTILALLDSDYRILTANATTTNTDNLTVYTNIVSPQITLTDQDASPNTVGEFLYDNTVTGILDGALAWYDDDAVRYLVDLATLPSDDDYVVAYDADADGFYMKADATGGGMAIGSAITSATSGSVLFVDGSGQLAQDNSNFFWDDTNDYFGIGTSTPAAHLVIEGDNGDDLLRIASSTAQNILLINDQGWLGMGTSTPQYKFSIEGNGNLIQAYDNANSNVFTVSDAQIVNAVPASFTGSGDVDIASNLYFSDPSASYIDSYSPLYITSGDPGTNNNLYLAGRGYGAVYIDGGTSGDMFRVTTSTNQTVLVMNTDGRMGIGTSTPSALLTIDASNPIGEILRIATSTNHIAMLMNTSGEVGIGVEPSYMLHVNLGSDGDVAGFTDTSGTCTINPTATALQCSSDERLKTDINSIYSGLELITSLRPVNYRWIKQEEGPLRFGFIAQEMEKIIPELVNEGPDGYKMVNSMGLIPFLVSSIQEQQKQINALNIDGNFEEYLNNAEENGKLVLNEDILLKKSLNIKEHANLGSDSAGRVTLERGKAKKHIQFEKGYEYPPIVTISPIGLIEVDYGVDAINDWGFDVIIGQILQRDIEFNWHAFGKYEAQIIEENITEEETVKESAIEDQDPEQEKTVEETITEEENQQEENITAEEEDTAEDQDPEQDGGDIAEEDTKIIP